MVKIFVSLIKIFKTISDFIYYLRNIFISFIKFIFLRYGNIFIKCSRASLSGYNTAT